MESNAFKGSFFGGFRRKDVIEYIEKSAAEANERIANLEGSNDGFARENDELRGELASASAERDRLSGELSEAQARLETLQSAMDAAQQELDTLHTRYKTLAAERDALQGEMAQLRPQAEEYAAVKAKLTELELAARQRGDAYEAEMHERADAYEREMNARVSELLVGCRSQCNLILAALDETCANVTTELRRSTDVISHLPAAFHSLRRDLSELDEKQG